LEDVVGSDEGGAFPEEKAIPQLREKAGVNWGDFEGADFPEAVHRRVNGRVQSTADRGFLDEGESETTNNRGNIGKWDSRIGGLHLCAKGRWKKVNDSEIGEGDVGIHHSEDSNGADDTQFVLKTVDFSMVVEISGITFIKHIKERVEKRDGMNLEMKK
jgi:hypothetical protein